MAGLAPDDEPQAAAGALAGSADALMLVGHLPHLARLASLLLGGGREPVRLEPGTALGFTGGADGWVLDWMVSPRLAGDGRSP
jgi:phosphohistidine phosphatase